MDKNSCVCVLGSGGLVGSALVRRLSKAGFTHLLAPTRKTLNLTEQAEVREYFAANSIDYVFMAAGTVGGIMANNTRPAEFIYDNTVMAANVIESCKRSNVSKLMLLGSSCIYPKHAPQPLSESSLLTGPLEPTNEWYAIAKINTIKMGQAYRRQYGMNVISVMPTNLYGPHDNFDPVSSHVLPGLIRKMHDARLAGSPSVTLWGSGTPRREFLHVDDLIDALLFLMENYDGEEIVNIGSGSDLTIAALASLVAKTVGFQGELTYDASVPDGTPVKFSDTSRLRAMGWAPKIDLEAGVLSTYEWFLANVALRVTP